MKNTNISVCMATYNGSLFIKDQIDSILTQLSDQDELVICDDCSSDNTVELINSYHDSRIMLHINSKNLGHVKNFEKAIGLATGNLIALSDQDDTWYPQRLQNLREALTKEDKNILVASNFDISNTSSGIVEKFTKLTNSPNNKILRILYIFLGRVPYYGCTFLMRKELAHRSIPFRDGIESHDIWIALIGNTYGNVIHMDKPTLCRRIHDNNLTPVHRRKIPVIIRGRIALIYAYLLLLLELKQKI
jgi:glycosyltransferase involved in cell wall biosynthesis